MTSALVPHPLTSRAPGGPDFPYRLVPLMEGVSINPDHMVAAKLVTTGNGKQRILIRLSTGGSITVPETADNFALLAKQLQIDLPPA